LIFSGISSEISSFLIVGFIGFRLVFLISFLSSFFTSFLDSFLVGFLESSLLKLIPESLTLLFGFLLLGNSKRVELFIFPSFLFSFLDSLVLRSVFGSGTVFCEEIGVFRDLRNAGIFAFPSF